LVLLTLPHHTYLSSSFLFIDTAPTEIYTLSLHDALPIFASNLVPYCSFSRCSHRCSPSRSLMEWLRYPRPRSISMSCSRPRASLDRKSTRLNSSHVKISYAVFCLKKKKKTQHTASKESI